MNVNIKYLTKHPNIWHELKLISEYSKEELLFKNSLILCNSWESIQKQFNIFNQSSMPHNWIFRGVKSIKYDLEASIQRLNINNYKRYEYFGKIYNEFKSSAHLYLDLNEIPENHDMLEWEALMQHHGCPTRFLDWTNSQFIALFFALDEVNIDNENYSCIWCINETLLTYMCWAELQKRNSSNARIKFFPEMINNQEVLRIINKESLIENNIGFIIPIRPNRKNLRLLSQQGLFTLFGNISFDFEFNLNTIIKNYQNNDYESYKLIKLILIPHEKRIIEEILSFLFSINISTRSLFPDIGGFAKSIKQYVIHDYFNIEKMDSWEENNPFK